MTSAHNHLNLPTGMDGHAHPLAAPPLAAAAAAAAAPADDLPSPHSTFGGADTAPRRTSLLATGIRPSGACFCVGVSVCVGGGWRERG